MYSEFSLKSFIANFNFKKGIILIFIIGFLVYFNSLFNGFVWDDEEQIVNNSIIQSFNNLPMIFSGGTFSTGGAGLSGWFFRPLLTFSYMLNYAIWGQNAFGFHLFQISLHLINAVLLFKILQKLTNDSKNSFKTLINFAVTLIFTVHSGIVEATVYIAAVSEVLFTFFNLFAFYLILRTTKLSWKGLILVCLSLFLGLLNKESSVVMFPILFSYITLFKFKLWKPFCFGLLLTLLIYFFIRLVLVNTPIRHPEFAPISEANLMVRLLTSPSEILTYLRLVFFPNELSISRHFLVTSATDIRFWGALILDTLVLFAAAFFALKLKSKLILFGILWFTLGIGIVCNIFPLDMTVAERWLYFPILGFILALAEFLQNIKFNEKTKYIIIAFFVCYITFLGIRTMVRNTNWVDGLTLYSEDIKISKNSFDLENNLGVELFRKGDYRGAKYYFERSIKLQPKWYFTYNNLGAVYEKERNYKKAEEFYKKTLELSDYYLAYENLSNVLFLQKKYQDSEEFTKEALKKLPNNAHLWLTLSLDQYNLKKFNEAKQSAKNAYLISPNEQTFYVYSTLDKNGELELK